MSPILFALAAMTAADPTPLPAAGPWSVRHEESLCLLERTYGTGKEKIGLIFQPLLDTGSMDVFVVGSTKSRVQKVGKATARVLPDVSYEGRYLSVWAPSVKARVTRITLDRSMLDALKEGDVLRVEATPIDVAFTLPEPQKARGALQSCIDNLKRAWGIDPANVARADGPVEGNPAKFFSSDSYPREAISKGVFGRVVAFLSIDETGAVTHCRILSSAGKELNEGTCTAARRIRSNLHATEPENRSRRPMLSPSVGCYRDRKVSSLPSAHIATARTHARLRPSRRAVQR